MHASTSCGSQPALPDRAGEPVQGPGQDEALREAIAHHDGGEWDLARARYRDVLDTAPEHALALFRFGLLELQRGHAEAAETLLRRSHLAAPQHERYALGLGHVLGHLQRWHEAAHVYRHIAAQHPRSANARYFLGMALQAQGEWRPAVQAYAECAHLDPTRADTHNAAGICHRALGEPAAAEAALRRALAQDARCAAAWSNLGTLLDECGQSDAALEALRTAVSLEPGVALHTVNLGVVLCRHQRYAEAVRALSAALPGAHDNAELLFNLGNALYGLGRLREAAERYREAVAQRLDHLDALNNLGNAYKQLGEFERSMQAYEAAARVRPDSVVVLNNLSCLLLALGRIDEAEAVLRRGLGVVRDHATLYNNLGNVLKAGGELDEALACFRTALSLEPTNAVAHSNLAYSMSFCSDDPLAILDECRRWNAQHAATHDAGAALPGASPGATRRLRIGYVSPDFRDHCQSLFTVPLLTHHDRTCVEVYAYSSVERADALTRRIRGLVDVWRDVAGLSDEALGERIRADRIDVLVDLTMHMANGRPQLFAARPAPVQIAWLAYPGTTGIEAMDYRISDPRLDPPGQAQPYSERTLLLPDSYWCYDPLCDDVEVAPLPAARRGHLTLGCLNNPCKLSERTLALWAQVMRALPRSRLLLMVPHGRHRQRLRERMQSFGVAGDRLDFVAYRPRREYLQTYHTIDLGLDTLPYNGHTTSLDSFWMGVPVVSRIGQTCVGRGGLSQLHQLGLLELAADSDAAFVDTAVRWGRDWPGLAALRHRLRPRMQACALMDGARFARHMEAAYRLAFEDRGARAL